MPNFIVMKQVNFPKTAYQRRTRSFKNFVQKDYATDISSIDILPVLAQKRNAHEICKYYQDQALAVMNKHAPYITLPKKQLDWKRKPWIGKRIQKIIKEKDRIYSKYLKRKSNFWYKRYRLLCDIVRNLSKKQRRNTSHGTSMPI